MPHSLRDTTIRTRIRRTALALAVLASTLGTPALFEAIARAALVPGVDFVPNRVIVKLKPQPSAKKEAGARDAVRSAMRGSLERRLDLIGADVLEVPERDVRSLVTRWKRDPRVEFVEPDYIVHASAVPNDPSFGSLWGMAMIQAPAAWDVTHGTDVLIGVIDTGVDYNHPDLAANIWTNPGEIAGNSIDDDGNGYVDDIHGYDFVNNDADPNDDQYHGTHVAGTIAAVGNNSLGVVGMNWTARIMALKFLGANGLGAISDAIRAVQYATQMGARLTNNSWGGGGYSQALRDAIQAAEAANSLFVAAAGNDHASEAGYPARYDLDNIISVAATDENDVIANFSNYNAVSVDLGAPGVDILSTFPTANPSGPYATISGTSMASPHVAGMAGLIWALRPTLSTEDVKRIILESVSPNASLAGKTVTGGRLNAFAAITLASGWVALDPPDISVSPLSLSFTLDPDASTTGLITISNQTANGRTLHWSIPTPACAWLTPSKASGSLVGNQHDDVQLGISAFGLAPGAYPCTLVVQSNDADEPSTQVTVDLTVSDALQPPEISLAPTSFSFSLLNGQAAGGDLTISNLVGAGQRNLHWSAALQGVGLGWIGISPTSGVTAPGAAGSVHLSVSATGLAAGSYDATIVVTSNDPDDPIRQVPVHLAVSAPPVGGQKLYLFGNNNSTTIVRTNLDGTNRETVYAGLTRTVSGAVTALSRTLYFIEWGPGDDEFIWRGDLHGINKSLFVSGVATAGHLAVDEAAGHLYYVEQYPTKRIMRVNLDGTGLVPLLTYTGQQVLDFELDLVNRKMYWAGDFPVSGVWRANLDGSNPERLITTQVCLGIALDPAAGTMYYGEGYPNYRVRRANLDGSAIQTIFSGQDGLTLELDVAGGKLYWVNRETDVVWRGNIDGTGAEAIAPFAYGIELDASPAFVAPPVCGDGRKTGDEQCDDGDATDGDGCSAICTLELGFGCVGTEPTVCTPTCGDGRVVGGETCDDGGTEPGDGCSAACTVEPGFGCGGEPSTCAPVCGDGQIVGGETCDDGDTQDNDGCSAACAIEPGFGCAGAPSVCTSICGDGKIVGTETCDDGDTEPGDGCSAICSRETGFACAGEPSSCTAVCGDGRILGAETCDDGGTTSGDGCSAACAVETGYGCDGAPSTCAPICGDGRIVGSETCDDGSTEPGDGCSAACAVEAGYGCTGEPSVCELIEVCGNGIVEGRETCDDGNTDGGDCCSSSCRREACTLSSAKDAFVLAGRPHQNQGANPWLAVRGAQSASGRDLNRTLVGFDLTGVGGTAVRSARLVLTIERNQHGWGSTGRSVAAHALLDEFVEGNGRSASPGSRGDGTGVTFTCAADTDISNSRQDCASSWSGGSHAPVASATALHTNRLVPGDVVVFDVTSDVQHGVEDWLIRQVVETQRGRVRYHSREASDPAMRPRLEIEY